MDKKHYYILDLNGQIKPGHTQINEYVSIDKYRNAIGVKGGHDIDTKIFFSDDAAIQYLSDNGISLKLEEEILN